MPANLPDSHELQRLADEMEARRIEARLKNFSQKPTPEERMLALTNDGWSLRTARDDIQTGGWGVPGAHTETRNRRKLGNLPDKGGRPSRKKR